MNKELEEIFSYFTLPIDEKAQKFDSILSNSMKLSEQIKEKLQNGSEEDKKQMEELLVLMAEKVQEETDRMCQEIGVTKEDLIAFTQNQDNFSKEEWDAIQDAKQYIREMEEGSKKAVEEPSKKINITDWVRS